MKPWNSRSHDLIKSAIEDNQASFEVRIDGILVQQRTDSLASLELALERYNPTNQELAVKIYSGKSNRSDTYEFGQPQPEKQGGHDVFELRLKVQELNGKLERTEERYEDKLERVREKLANCEKALENRTKALKDCQQEIAENKAKQTGWVQQAGDLVTLAQRIGNGSPPPPTAPAPQVGGVTEPPNEWAESIQGLGNLSPEQKETVKDLLCRFALEPNIISTINDLIQ